MAWGTAEIRGWRPGELGPSDLAHEDQTVERSTEIDERRFVQTRLIFLFHSAVDT